MLEQVKENIGRTPDATSADAGYFSEAAIEKGQSMGTELLVRCIDRNMVTSSATRRRSKTIRRRTACARS